MGGSGMSKRAPYLEIIVTVVAMGFLGLVILGSFDQRSNVPGQMTMRAD
jgi:hypothetical protein